MSLEYFLLDARAGMSLSDRIDIDDYTIFLIGSAQEVCAAADSEEFGKGCVVTDNLGNIQWEWIANKDGRWSDGC